MKVIQGEIKKKRSYKSYPKKWKKEKNVGHQKTIKITEKSDDKNQRWLCDFDSR